jgi:hypothetical protein
MVPVAGSMTGVAVMPISGEMSPLLTALLGTDVTVPPCSAVSRASCQSTVPLVASMA